MGKTPASLVKIGGLSRGPASASFNHAPVLVDFGEGVGAPHADELEGALRPFLVAWVPYAEQNARSVDPSANVVRPESPRASQKVLLCEHVGRSTPTQGGHSQPLSDGWRTLPALRTLPRQRRARRTRRPSLLPQYWERHGSRTRIAPCLYLRRVDVGPAGRSVRSDAPYLLAFRWRWASQQCRRCLR